VNVDNATGCAGVNTSLNKVVVFLEVGFVEWTTKNVITKELPTNG
jgi:hypothetical protein